MQFFVVADNAIANARFMTNPESSKNVPEVELEVQIVDQKDVYDKKTKKTLEGLEYRLEDSKVTVMVQASDEITSVRAYTRRCPEAAMRTHDTIGRLLQGHLYASSSIDVGRRVLLVVI